MKKGQGACRNREDSTSLGLGGPWSQQSRAVSWFLCHLQPEAPQQGKELAGSGSCLKDPTGGREANGLQEARRAGMGASWGRGGRAAEAVRGTLRHD